MKMTAQQKHELVQENYGAVRQLDNASSTLKKLVANLQSQVLVENRLLTDEETVLLRRHTSSILYAVEDLMYITYSR